MKVLKAKVRWDIQWDNTPGLEMLVDQIPSRDVRRYRRYPLGGESALYISETEGYVSHYTETSDHSGLGGRAVDLTLDTGEHVTVRGPWLGSTSALSTYGVHAMDVSITDEPEVWERGHTFFAGAVTLSVVREAIRWFCPMAELVSTTCAKGSHSLTDQQNAIVTHGLSNVEMVDTWTIVRRGLTPVQTVGWKRFHRYLRLLSKATDPIERQKYDWWCQEIVEEYGLTPYMEADLPPER
jgi:hypothetical protein